MFSVLASETSSLGLSNDWGYGAVSLNKTLDSHSASLHTGV